MPSAAIRPLLRLWARRRSSLLALVPRPEDAPVARVPGPDRVRVLLVGNGPAAGWGVRSHDLALPGRLAQRIARATGRGAQIDVRTDHTARMAVLPMLLARSGATRYDAVAVVGGMSDAVELVPLDAWREQLEVLLDRLLVVAPRAAVLVMGVQPVRSVSVYATWPGRYAEQHRVAMNRITEAVCRERGIGYAPLPAPVRPPSRPGHRSPEVYEEWGDAIADPLIAALPAAAPRDRDVEQDERDRQRAVAAILGDGSPSTQLDRITARTRSAFGVSMAAVTLIDDDLHRFRSLAGATLGPMPRAWSFCARTILSDEPFVVGDLASDHRFDDNPVVHGEAGIRFYAGHPIESPDGHRVGALCILDTEPRDPASVDLDVLSDMALLAQKELWAEGGAPTS